jgi:heme exporter protein A
MTSQPFLHVTNFTYARGGRTLFKELSFTLKEGEALILMGPNGSGKTTLLRCIAGIPESIANIHKVCDLSQSYVGHLNALKGDLTVRQNLLNQTEATSEQVTKYLAMQGLSDFENRKVRTLSVGQRRQVALARLSLSNSKLWLVDEPTTHLDERASQQFWKMLEAHLQAGGAAVISSHAPVPISCRQVVHLHE